MNGRSRGFDAVDVGGIGDLVVARETLLKKSSSRPRRTRCNQRRAEVRRELGEEAHDRVVGLSDDGVLVLAYRKPMARGAVRQHAAVSRRRRLAERPFEVWFGIAGVFFVLHGILTILVAVTGDP